MDRGFLFPTSVKICTDLCSLFDGAKSIPPQPVPRFSEDPQAAAAEKHPLAAGPFFFLSFEIPSDSISMRDLERIRNLLLVSLTAVDARLERTLASRAVHDSKLELAAGFNGLIRTRFSHQFRQGIILLGRSHVYQGS